MGFSIRSMERVRGVVFIGLMLFIFINSVSANETITTKILTEEEFNPGFTETSMMSNQNISMEFRDTDIGEIIEFVSEITGLTIVKGSKVTGRVTIINAKGLTKNDSLIVLRSALEVEGFTLIKEEGLIKIIPLVEGKQVSMPVSTGKVSGSITTDQMITQVIPIEHTNANRLIGNLKPLLSLSGNIFAAEDTNMLVVTDLGANVKKIVEIVNILDCSIAVPKERNVSVYYLQNAKAEDLAKMLNELYSKEQTLSGGKKVIPPGNQPPGETFFPSPVIVSGIKTNSLIILSSQEDYQSLIKVIEKLDIMSAQVLIEALIVEVSLEDSSKLGVEWSNQWNTFNDEHELSSTYNLQKTFELYGGFKYSILTEDGFSAILQAMKKESKVNILSAPRILTCDNKEASIVIGTEQPYQTGTQITGETTQTTYEYKDVGITLKVTPHINNEGYVAMDVHQEIKKITETTHPIVVSKREANTSVIVKDKQTVVIGGLMKNDRVETIYRIPILGSLPLLGWLFRKKEVSFENTELLVFITPRIATQEKELDEITSSEKKKFPRLDTVIK